MPVAVAKSAQVASVATAIFTGMVLALQTGAELAGEIGHVGHYLVALPRPRLLADVDAVSRSVLADDQQLLDAGLEQRFGFAEHLADGAFNHLAHEVGVKVIHCSERDTQITDKPKQVDEFVNTWSVEGFREEGTTTAEMGWGTHEKTLPKHAFQHKQGPKNQICLAQMGINVWVRSFVPNWNILGMVVRHGEAFTISDKLTVWKNGKAVYRPTMHYAYCPCDEAIASLNELRGYDYKLQPKVRILGDEITQGYDILGALLMGHAYNSWWIGSDLTIEESRRLVPHQNATTMQVAISVVAAQATNNWKLTRESESGEWKLADAKGENKGGEWSVVFTRKLAGGGDAANYEELTYEIFGPHGVALLVDDEEGVLSGGAETSGVTRAGR